MAERASTSSKSSIHSTMKSSVLAPKYTRSVEPAMLAPMDTDPSWGPGCWWCQVSQLHAGPRDVVIQEPKDVLDLFPILVN